MSASPGLRHVMLDLAKPQRQRMKVRKRQFRLVDHRVGRDEDRILRQVPDPDPLGQRHHPRINRHLLEQHLEERGLPASVVPDQSHALAAIDREIQLVKHDTPAESLLDVAERRDSHGSVPHSTDGIAQAVVPKRITSMLKSFALLLSIAAAGCAQSEFNVTREGDRQPLRVGAAGLWACG